LSDISLNWGPFDILAIALMIGAPGFGVGAVCGELAWRARRGRGAMLGGVGGLVAGIGAFAVWDASRASVHMDFRDAALLWLGLPGLVAGAAVCGWRWRRGRLSRIDLGAFASGALWLGGWWLAAR
jgi:hypothetical protein